MLYTKIIFNGKFDINFLKMFIYLKIIIKKLIFLLNFSFKI